METILFVTNTPDSPAEKILRAAGFDIVTVGFSDDVMKLLENDPYRVAVLDFDRRETAMLPVIRLIRTEHPHLAVVAIDNSTPGNGQENAVQGINAGADEYFIYPFDIRLLSAKMGALFRRFKFVEDGSGTYHFGGFVLDYPNRSVDVGDQDIRLTHKEASMLRLLCMYKGRVLPRAVALRTIWYDDSYYNGRSMDVVVAGLRKKLGPYKVRIITERSRGYVLLT